MTPEFAVECFLKACVEDGGMDSGALKAAMAAYVGAPVAQPQGKPAWHVALQPLVRWQRQGENMNFIADLPKSPGTYRHRWIDHAGRMKEQTLFVGYTNARAPLLQGTEPNAYMPRKLKCCPPEEYLHADRLTPEEWGGWWEHVTPNAEITGLSG